MTQAKPKQITTGTLGLTLLACLAVIALGKTPTVPPADARGVIRLRVRVKVGDAPKPEGLSRKRFFLIKGSLEENKSLIQSFELHTIVSRDCYYRGIGASEAFISWLKQHNCESVYCREVEQKDVEGTSAVPEFQHAAAAGEKEYGSRELARKWLAVNLTDELRSGFYKRRQQDLQAFIRQAEAKSKARVMSVMTDRFGTAYFTDIEPGTYVISNLIPIELGAVTESWNCEITVKPGDLATEKPFLIANPGNKERNVRCVSVERALPACPSPNK